MWQGLPFECDTARSPGGVRRPGERFFAQTVNRSPGTSAATRRKLKAPPVHIHAGLLHRPLRSLSPHHRHHGHHSRNPRKTPAHVHAGLPPPSAIWHPGTPTIVLSLPNGAINYECHKRYPEYLEYRPRHSTPFECHAWWSIRVVYYWALLAG
jgi:hypothetical protein